MPHHADFLTQKSTKRWWRSHDAEVDLTCAMAIFLKGASGTGTRKSF
jgi:hypothetical protein